MPSHSMSPSRWGARPPMLVLFFAATIAILSTVDPRAHPAVLPAAQRAAGTPAPVSLPGKDGSLKFAAFGDFGDGSQREYEMAEQIAKSHDRFPFEMVALLGDNLYGSERPQDF